MAKECMLSAGELSLGGLPRNSVARITDRCDMTSAVYHRCKAINQTNKLHDNYVALPTVPISGQRMK